MRMVLAITGMMTAFTGAAYAADARHPTVVELYQSQGCSSCPPALAVLDAIAGRKDILALNFGVTYWDQLGWKDRFARPEFTARQWDYARAGGRRNVATPQMIINGRTTLIGHDRKAVDAAIARNDRGKSGPLIAVEGRRVKISAGRAAKRGATIWLASYDPRTIRVAIGSGENGGRTLPHRNVVRSLEKLGSWRGIAKSFVMPPSVNGLAEAVLVQDGTGGPIIAVRKL